MLFGQDFKRVISGTDSPADLPGVKKRSFVLPFNGGEIWFEHLDGMYQYTDLVLDKLRTDAKRFTLPSMPSLIGFVLDETVITEEVTDAIADVLCGGKRFTRVAFIGTDRNIRYLLRRSLSGRSHFAKGYINDFERAKEWLVSEGQYFNE